MTYPQQPGYPPQQPVPPVLYSPQQPAPQYYPQVPGAPVGSWAGMAGQAPAPPAPPALAKGSLKSFANQPNAAFGKGLKFDVVGRWYLMRVARALNDGDSRQATDPKLKTPLWNSDGSPKEQLCVPVIVRPGITPEHPTGAATFYVQSKNQREELTRAITEAGLADLTEVRGGDVIFVMLTGERGSGMGNPAKVYQMRYTRAEQVDEVWGAEAPPLAPIDAPQQAQQAPPPPPVAPAPQQYAAHVVGSPAGYPVQQATPQYAPAQPYPTGAEVQQAPQQYAPVQGWQPAGSMGGSAVPQPQSWPIMQGTQQPQPVEYQQAVPAPPQQQAASQPQGPPPAPPGVPQPPAAANGAPPPMTEEQQARMQQLANLAAPVQQAPPAG